VRWFWPGLTTLWIMSSVLAVLTYRRQRRFGLPWAGIWAGLVFLFGLPMYLAYRVHRVWPARLPCPNCNQPVSRDRPACFRCHELFPLPSARGIEIFEA
jgi:hypothetical protein